MIVLTAVLLLTAPGVSPAQDGIGDPAADSLPPLSLDLPSFRPLVQFRLGAEAFFDDEMRESYGFLPGAELGFSQVVNRRAHFYASVGYFRAQGDPYFDQPGFEDPDGLLLQAIPIQFGLKLDASDVPGFRLFLGAGMGAHYVRERVPSLAQGGAEEGVTASGMLMGWRYFIGPELEVGQGCAGVELGFGGSRGRISNGDHRHDIDLWPFQTRAYYAIPLR